MNKNTLNTPLFRIAFPLLFGIIVYILVLVFFGSASQIIDNFFSQEALLCVAITIILDESLLFLHKIAFRKLNMNQVLMKTLLFSSSTFISVLIVSIIISLYFNYILDLSNYKRELLIFNLIYGISTLLYCIVWIGIDFMQKQNLQILEKEKLIENNLQQEFNNLILNTEPEIFYSTLEYVISLLESNPDSADEYINKLSTFYRNRLETKDDEIISLETELKTFRLLIELLNIKHNGNITVDEVLSDVESLKIRPFTLVKTFKEIEKQNIINKLKPLEIKLLIEDEKLLMKYLSFPKLQQAEQESIEKTIIFELKSDQINKP